jgi:hypothetical protein
VINLRRALARYAASLHNDIGRGHGIASPLGAWLLLALCAPASTGNQRQELTDVLGMAANEAFRVASALVSTEHPLVGSAAAVWTRQPMTTAALANWASGLPSEVERGEMPSQGVLDAWARERTLGLIEEFPVLVGPETALVLATALATKVGWATPFELGPAALLGRSSGWSRSLNQVLVTPARAQGHESYIASTVQAGDVAVHTATALAPPDDRGSEQTPAGLAVTSVIAAADVPPERVLAAAYDIATEPAASRRSLFDLPLADTPLWTIREQPTQTTNQDAREERCTAVLPAWSTSSRHDLSRADGFPAAAEALANLMQLHGWSFGAVQSAVARYHRVGFEAAAITAMWLAGGATQVRVGVLRTAQVRFGHPYAVIAVATQPGGPWDGVPVFSAWVADPENPED